MIGIPTLAMAFGAGFAAAAPVGPVNAVAIRRGLIGRWKHTMLVAIGSMFVETGYIALGLYAGQWAMERIKQPFLRWVGLPGAVILVLFGALMLRRGLGDPQRARASARLERMRSKNLTAFRDLGLGAGLTIINPLTLLYWLSMAPKWIQFAGLPPHSPAIWLGLAAGACGLAMWFTFITSMVALRPQNVGPRFLRAVNCVCGLALTAGGLVLAWQVVRG